MHLLVARRSVVDAANPVHATLIPSACVPYRLSLIAADMSLLAREAAATAFCVLSPLPDGMWRPGRVVYGRRGLGFLDIGHWGDDDRPPWNSQWT